MEKRHIVLDTETTGLDVEKGHRIIEIGGVVTVSYTHLRAHET